VECVEGRTLLSGLHPLLSAKLHGVHAARAHFGPNLTNSAGAAAILGALHGGLGSEWVSLIRHETRNLNGVIGGFVSGRLSTYSIPGLVMKTPAVEPSFRGQPYDQLVVTSAGAMVGRNQMMEFGAIMRGPFHDPSPTVYVFALNRGAGAGLGPTFASRPGITPDALVELTIEPFGASATGRVVDLADGSTQAIAPSSIRIAGPTLRVFLNASQLPSMGFSLRSYQFAFWAQTRPGNDITTVASFAPESSMIRIGLASQPLKMR
jgi:hypothetical protein